MTFFIYPAPPKISPIGMQMSQALLINHKLGTHPNVDFNRYIKELKK